MGVALITPFKEDDSVDYDALLRLVDYQLQMEQTFYACWEPRPKPRL